MTNAISIAQGGSSNTTFRNRIINGAMVIDQRNAGASVTPASGQYLCDRFCYQSSQASKFSYQKINTTTNMPAGFSNYSRFTVAATATVAAGDFFAFEQPVEGYNIADFNWGTANAQTVTLSFWVRSSVTGTFGGSVQGITSSYRSYPFSYTISSANTWTQVSVAVPGDTSSPTGGWNITNGAGIYVWFGLTVGTTYSGAAGSWSSTNYVSVTGNTSLMATLGATIDFTGVQLEAGSKASPFEQRLYGTELMLCQRYYESTAYPDAGFTIGATRIGVCLTSNAYSTGFNFIVPKRTNAPTVTLYSRNGNSGKVSLIATGADVSGTSTVSNLGGTGFWGVALGAAQTAGAGIETGWTASAEL